MTFNRSLFFAVALGAALTGCEKEATYNKKSDTTENAVVYLQQATTFPQELTTFPFIDDARTFKFNAGFGAVGYSSKDINVKFEVDNAAFDSINLTRQSAGLPLYLRFPTDAYTIDAMETTIASGSLTSGTISVKYFSKKFDPLLNYLLPISIKDASGYKVNGKLKTVFIVVSKLQGKAVPANVKATWTITASGEEPAEAPNGYAAKAIDGDLSTFWHSPWAASSPPYPHWLQIDMKQQYYVDKVGLAPRQNNGNGFVSFRLEASNDGTSWTLLGDNLVFDPNKRDGTFQDYSITPAQWQHFRVTMLQPRIAGNTSTHLAEINVYKY
ncbi:MAG: discoidin domain-containing protein [Lacibacter sp.]